MIILGSQSPRRKEILSYFSLPFQQHSPDFDEEAVPWRGNPEDYAITIAQGKAQSLLGQFPDQPILTADTVVYRNGNIYLKPKDEEEAYRFFSDLTGNWHSVFTGVALRLGDQEFTSIEETKVLFNSLSEQQIRLFLRHLPYSDKAGGYFIQEAGSLIAQKIEGCFYNVMGLPINTVHTLLLKLNIDLWNYLIPPRKDSYD